MKLRQPISFRLASLVPAVALSTVLLASSNAHAAPSCRAVFSVSEQLVRELAILRADIAAKKTAGESDVAKVLYSKYQEKVNEAQKSGIDTSALLRMISERETSQTEERASESRRAREALVTEHKMQPWVKAHTINDAHLNKFRPAALSPDGTRIAYAQTFGPAQDSLIVRDVAGTKPPLEYKIKDLMDFDIDWQRDIVFVNKLTDKGYLTSMYSLSTGKGFLPGMPFQNIDFHPTQPWIVTTLKGKSAVLILNYQTGKVEKTLEARTDFVEDEPRSPLFSPDGQRVVVDSSGLLEIFDLVHGTKQDFQTGERMGVAFLPDSRHLAIPRFDGKIEIVDVTQNLKVIRTIPTGVKYSSVKFDATGERMILGAEHVAQVLNFETGTVLHSFRSGEFVWTDVAKNAPAFIYQAGEKIEVFKAAPAPLATQSAP